jgi:hypothetical protein
MCDIGVRQGLNFPPFLFAIYLNDLEQFFVENNVNCLENIRNVCSENLNRVIVSKAFEKSTNVQYNICPRDIYIEINACKLNMLSNVLYPFLNPVWDSEIKPTSSDNSHNLSFFFCLFIVNFLILY